MKGNSPKSRCSVWLFTLIATLTPFPPAAASPDLLVPALEYGAKDCSFCHLTPQGGEAHNERGIWLVAERDRRGVEKIDVAWLAVRDKRVAKTEQPSRTHVHLAELPAMQALPADRKRPVDYTTAHGDWPAYGGGLRAQKFSPLGQISADNIDDLAIAWVWEAFDNHRYTGLFDRFNRNKTPDGFKATPLVVAGRMFVRTAFSAVAAIDPVNGQTLWTYDPGTGDGPRPPVFGFSTRGLAYHRGDDGDRILLVTSDGWLIALSADTGEPLPGFGQEGRVDLTTGLRRPLSRRANTWNYAPALCGDVVVLGNQTHDASHMLRNWRDNVPLGDVRGFDVRTGRQMWVFKTIPQAGEFGNDTWGEESWKWMGNTNVWSMMSCDPELGIVYLPVTAPSSHFYGGLRPGDNLFGTSVVALDARTGKRKWHFQTVHHDIWDYDLPAAPVVADIVMDGKPVKAVAQVSKVGFLYVFDRVTGEPLWPIEERPVPKSTLDGEQAAATQPFPTWPPPFEMQGLAEDDLIDFTPELRRLAQDELQGIRTGGLFLPPSTEGSLAIPGWGGGANWGGAAFDPETRMLYVASRREPLLMTARPVSLSRNGQPYRIRPTGFDMDGIPVVKPPWSSITAYRLDTGEVAWKVANGRGPKEHPLLEGLDLPDLGDRWNAPGLLVTRHLIFHGHRKDGGTTLRALDKMTGALVWEHPVQGTHQDAPPMAYMAGGRQFVVLATGAGVQPARLIAFRLP
ncbi:MAG: PQQ-binding-like beta-propeller repeat protein [Gammaproteobacteria bacterium]|nr:PQQ-binding-like beta-propeller repeat protein [Gammaproteobacteria bacterium]